MPVRFAATVPPAHGRRARRRLPPRAVKKEIQPTGPKPAGRGRGGGGRVRVRDSLAQVGIGGRPNISLHKIPRLREARDGRDFMKKSPLLVLWITLALPATRNDLVF